MAIVGAATLAQAVTSSTDLAEALSWYEQVHRRRLAARHRGTGLTSHFLVPASRVGVAVRDGAFRISPTISALGGDAEPGVATRHGSADITRKR